jgi:hypothetical protein
MVKTSTPQVMQSINLLVQRSVVGKKTKGNDPLIVWYGLPLLKRGKNYWHNLLHESMEQTSKYST